MGLMLARDAFFARQGTHPAGWAAEDIRTCKVLCSENAHFSVQKNMCADGPRLPLSHAGENRRIRADGHVRSEAKIAQAQADGEQIMAIVATAGTTDAGAIDPLRDIAGIAAEHQIWLHVDAAWAARAV